MKSEELRSEEAVRTLLVPERSCTVELVPGGPALVRGAATVQDAAGDPHPVRRPVVAVCTCGLTQRGPWCDATHKAKRAT